MAAWLVVAAVMMLLRGALVKAYLLAETALAVPTAFYIAELAVRRGGNFAPARIDLVLTFLLFRVFSVIPIGLAMGILSRGREAIGP